MRKSYGTRNLNCDKNWEFLELELVVHAVATRLWGVKWTLTTNRATFEIITAPKLCRRVSSYSWTVEYEDTAIPRSFETSITTCRTSQRHIPESFNPQRWRFRNVAAHQVSNGHLWERGRGWSWSCPPPTPHSIPEIRALFHSGVPGVSQRLTSIPTRWLFLELVLEALVSVCECTPLQPQSLCVQVLCMFDDAVGNSYHLASNGRTMVYNESGRT